MLLVLNELVTISGEKSFSSHSMIMPLVVLLWLFHRRQYVLLLLLLPFVLLIPLSGSLLRVVVGPYVLLQWMLWLVYGVLGYVWLLADCLQRIEWVLII